MFRRELLLNNCGVFFPVKITVVCEKNPPPPHSPFSGTDAVS